MANTYFKYAERNAENRINWADVGKDMTDMLADEARVREEKKAAIETDFRDFSKTLADSPMGESQGFNEFTTDYADSAQEYSLMVNNMLKSGDLKLREYNNIQANLKQGTAEAFSIATDYNTAYKGMLERGEIDPETGLPAAQLLEQYVLGTVQGFGNYSDHRLWINPTTGKVSLATTQTDKEGNVTMNRDTGSFIAVNALRNRTRAQYDIYDLNKVNAARVNTLGTTIDAVMSDGVKTRENALNNASVVAVLDDFADATVAIPTNVSSILTNSLGTNPNTGERYAFTDNPADAALDENLILIMDNPLQQSAGLPMPAYLDSPEQLTEYLNENFEDLSYTDDEGNNVSHSQAVAQIVENNTKQVDAARTATKTSLVSMLDRKETTMAEFDPFRGSYTTYKEKTELEDNAVGLWSEAYSLPADKRQIVLDAMVSAQESLKNGLVELSIDGDQIIYRYKNDDKTHTIKIGSDDPTREEWVRLGAEFHGVSDVERMTDYAGNFTKDDNGKFKPYIKSARLVSAKREAVGEKPEDRVAADVLSIVTEDLISGNESSDLEKLKPLASALGYEVSKAFDGKNIVTLKVPGKDGAKLEITNDTTAKTIQDWMIANTDETRAASYIRTLPKEMEEEETLEERAAETTGSGSLDNLGQ